MEQLLFRIRRRLKIYYRRSIRFFVSLHERDRKLIIYGGALDCFIDNAKHLFIYNNNYLVDYRHVWLSNKSHVLNHVNSLGFKAVKSNSLEGLRMILKAGMVIYDNRIDEFSYHVLSEGAVRLNLWHGVPMCKRIGLVRTDPPVPYIVNSPFHYKRMLDHVYGDYVLSTTKNANAIFSAAFQIPIENIVISDYPRCRFLYMSENELDCYISKYENVQMQSIYNALKKEKSQKVIYMPTFRDADPCYIDKAIPQWDILDDFLRSQNIKFYVKVHRMTPLPKLNNFTNIVILDNALDIYPILPLFDRMVTDYSSIMFEFAKLRKPIIIYDFDLDDYINNSRYIYKSFLSLLGSLTEARTFAELENCFMLEDERIELFPEDGYFDTPGNTNALSIFIEALQK